MLYPVIATGVLVGGDQVSDTDCGVVPVPLSATLATLPVVELLLMVSWPETAPADVGRK